MAFIDARWSKDPKATFAQKMLARRAVVFTEDGEKIQRALRVNARSGWVVIALVPFDMDSGQKIEGRFIVALSDRAGNWTPFDAHPDFLSWDATPESHYDDAEQTAGLVSVAMELRAKPASATEHATFKAVVKIPNDDPVVQEA